MRTYLWKEVREQRALFGALAVILVVLAFVSPLAMPYEWESEIPQWLFRIALIAGVALLGSDLIPGERLDHLARLPAAASRAFVAKVIVLLTGIALLVGLAWLAVGAALPMWWSFPSTPFAIALCGAALAVAPWVMAVSCWLSRSVLVAPATVLLFAIVVGPIVLMLWGRQGILPSPTESYSLEFYLAVAGLALARWSFGRRLRHGTRLGAVAGSVAVAIAALLPLDGWGLHRLWLWHHVDPHDATISSGYLGADGRVAFLTLIGNLGMGPSYAVRVDLTSGAWQQDGPAQSYYLAPGILHAGGGEFFSGVVGQHPILMRSTMLPSGEGVQPDASLFVDTRSGNTLARFNGRDAPAELRDKLRGAKRATTPLRLADGRRVVFFDDALFAVAADGSEEPLPWQAGDRPWRIYGNGFRVVPGKPNRFYDLARQRVIECVDDGPWIRAGAWIVQQESGRRGRPRLWDPDTDTLSQVRGLGPDEELGPPVDDRHFVVYRRDAPGLRLLDPETGERRELAFADAMRPAIKHIGAAHWSQPIALLTPSGKPVFTVITAAGSRLARLDGNVLTCTAASERISYPLDFDDDTAIVIAFEERRLERVHFGSERRELLFPR